MDSFPRSGYLVSHLPVDSKSKENILLRASKVSVPPRDSRKLVEVLTSYVIIAEQQKLSGLQSTTNPQF